MCALLYVVHAYFWVCDSIFGPEDRKITGQFTKWLGQTTSVVLLTNQQMTIIFLITGLTVSVSIGTLE